jgi:hypothetical protein
MGTPSAGREQAAVNRAASWPTGQERKQARRGLCLQHQGAARPRNRACPPCPTSLRAVREPMAAAWQLNPAHGCRKRGATLKAARPGLHPRSRLFATRSPVQPKAITMVTRVCRARGWRPAWPSVAPCSRPSRARPAPLRGDLRSPLTASARGTLRNLAGQKNGASWPNRKTRVHLKLRLVNLICDFIAARTCRGTCSYSCRQCRAMQPYAKRYGCGYGCGY